MTFKNGGQRDESSPNRKVSRYGILNPADFPNLPPEAIALAQSDPEMFDRMYPLKLHDLGMLRGV